MSIEEASFLIGKLERLSVAGLLFSNFIHNVGLRWYVLRRIEGFSIVFIDLFTNLKGFFLLKLNFILKLFLLI